MKGDETVLESLSFDVVATLAPVRRARGLRRLARWALLGAGGGALTGVVILAAAHLHPIAFGVPLALAALCAGVVGGASAGALRWPDSLEAARAADRHFDLRDRVTTALELGSSEAPLSQLQRSEAARRLAGLPLARSGRERGGRRDLALAVAALLSFTALLASGVAPSSRGGSTNTPSDAPRIHRVATTRLPKLQRRLAQGLTPLQRQSVALRKLDAALSRLRHQLLHTQSRSAALRSISLTQQELHRVAAGLHPVSPRAVAQLNSALARSMTSRERAATQGKGALKAAAAALNRLAGALAHMSPAQRSRLAQSLARAANSTTDPSLRSALHAAASSLGYGDPQSAAASLRAAAGALSGTPNARTAQSRLAAASASLESLKGQISGVAGQATGPATSGQGAGSGSGKGSGQGSGKGSGQGSGKGSGNGSGKGSGQGSGKGSGQGQGSGSGSGKGSGQGSGQGQGSGSGGTGGHGIGGGRGGAGPRGQGRYATVYVGGKEHAGPHSIGTGPNGRPLPGGVVPYRQVVGAYAASAHAALARSSLSPGQQSTVRRYFSSLSR